VIIAGTAALPILLLIAGAIAIIVLKRKRTLRRRSAASPSIRIAGAWREVVDRYEEAGVRRMPDATPNEFVQVLAERGAVAEHGADDLFALADDLDEALYHPLPRSPAQADDAWNRSDRLVSAMGAEQGVTTRLRRQLDPRPLLRKDPLFEDDHDA
jgi:hypothetical protein